MIGTECEFRSNIDDGIASDDTSGVGSEESLLNSGYEFTGNDTSDDLVFEDCLIFQIWICFSFFCSNRLKCNRDITKLSSSTRLLLVYPLLIDDGLSNRFTICDLRCTRVRLDFKFSLHPIHEDLEVKLTHTGYDSLIRLGIGVDLE